MQINYAGRISKDDFWQALSHHNKQQYRVYQLILLAGAILLWLSVWFLVGSPGSDEVVNYALYGELILVVAMTFPQWITLLQWSSYAQKGNIYRNNVFGSINDAGITINSPEININFQWSVFDNFRDTKDILLLYQGKNYFYWFIPSLFSSQEEWQNFVSFAKEKVSINKKSA